MCWLLTGKLESNLGPFFSSLFTLIFTQKIAELGLGKGSDLGSNGDFN